jgi:hypothetical protein
MPLKWLIVCCWQLNIRGHIRQIRIGIVLRMPRPILQALESSPQDTKAIDALGFRLINATFTRWME